MPRRVMDEPVETIIKPKEFYAWNKRRTLQHRVHNVDKIHDYNIDTKRWANDFSAHLTVPLPPTPVPSTPVPSTPGPIRTQTRSSRRSAPYSSSPDLSRSRRGTKKSPQKAAAAAASAMDLDDRDKAVLAEVLRKIRPRNSRRRTGQCIQCGEKSDKTSGRCGDACIAAWIEEHREWETTHLELRHTRLGYGVFVRPGCGGIPANTELAVYAGELLPFDAPEVSIEAGSRYLFELQSDLPKKGDMKKYMMIINAQKAGNWTRFVNSHCEPNCVADTVALGKRMYILFETKYEALAEGEELTLCYGPEYFSEFAAAGTACLCDAVEGPHIPPKGA